MSSAPIELPQTPRSGEPDIPERIRTLPQELQNIILEFYEEVALPTHVTINRSFTQPLMLQYNRAIRSKIRQRFYGSDTIFYTAYDDLKLFNKWLKSLTRADRDGIKNIRIQRPERLDDLGLARNGMFIADLTLLDLDVSKVNFQTNVMLSNATGWSEEWLTEAEVERKEDEDWNELR